MTINILFSALHERWDQYRETLPRALGAVGIDDVHIARELPPESVDYVVFAPNGPVKDFSPFVNCRAVLSLWAGVETIAGNPTLTQPLCRMVDDGLRQGMVEWVVGHCLRHHLGMDIHINGQDGVWRDFVPPLAKDRPVTILGLGALGAACGQALAGLGFPTRGWSRSPKTIEGIESYHGETGLESALSGSAIVVLLLPDTPATRNTLNTRSLALLARGAFVLNPGRGPLINDDDLIAALESGQVAHATLDTFRVEPLPQDHPFWRNPNVTVTPHIASETRAETASQIIAENIRRSEAGEPLLFLVDRTTGY